MTHHPLRAHMVQFMDSFIEFVVLLFVWSINNVQRSTNGGKT